MEITWDKIEWTRWDDEDRWHSYLQVRGVLLISGFTDPGPAQVFKAHLAKKIREQIEAILDVYNDVLPFLNVSRPDPAIKEWTVEIDIWAGRGLTEDDRQSGKAVLRRRLEGKRETLLALFSLQAVGGGVQQPPGLTLKWRWAKQRVRPPGMIGG